MNTRNRHYETPPYKAFAVAKTEVVLGVRKKAFEFQLSKHLSLIAQMPTVSLFEEFGSQ